MSVIQVQAFDLPLFPEGASPFVLRDGKGRLLVDPLFLRVRRDEVLFLSLDESDDDPLVYHFENVPFTDLEWLMPRCQLNRPTISEGHQKRASLVRRYCLDCVADLPARIVDVVLLDRA
jgi:hypothetical protein